ncbi:MAG: carbohydrate kinase family protein, partial [Chloroflexota bacterium]|nr:carbohydrate kinase family protein [Chloroflexota bacterium]
GDDPAGATARAALARDGVDTRGEFRDPAGTARSVNLVFGDGRRRFFYDGKGHMGLRPDLAASRSVLAGARLAHVNIPNWARLVLPVARELGVPVGCDVQDVADPDDPYRRDFALGADYLFFSAANHPDPAPVMRAWWGLKPGLVMVAGMGARGCALGADGEVRVFPPPPIDLPVVDTNGAGDALAVGFLAARVLEGRSVEEAVRWGQTAARHTSAQPAPKTDLVTSTALRGYLAALAK